MAEEIDVEKCDFRQFSELQKHRDLDLASGGGHTCAHCAYLIEVYPHTKLIRAKSD